MGFAWRVLDTKQDYIAHTLMHELWERLHYCTEQTDNHARPANTSTDSHQKKTPNHGPTAFRNKYKTTVAVDVLQAHSPHRYVVRF